jgi:two-component system, NarL family, sensor kinase
MKRPVTWLFLFIAFCFVFQFISETSAQDTDSLNRAIDEILNNRFSTDNAHHEEIQKDSIIILRYLTEASKLESRNYDSSLFYIKRALDLSLRSGSLKFISLSTQALGGYYINRESFQDAMFCYLKSLAIEEKRKDEIRIAALYDELGRVYYYMEIFDKSLDYYQKALGIYQGHKDTLGIADVFNHVGLLHRSREFCETRNVEEKQIDFETATSYYEKSAVQYSLIGNRSGLAKVNVNLANVYYCMSKPEIALGYIQKSLDYYRKTNDIVGISEALYTIGEVYWKTGDFEKSIQALNESEEISLKHNLTNGIQYLYEKKAMVFNDLRDYKPAYDYYLKYMTIRDSVFTIEKARQLFEIETKYQNEVKQNQILKLTSEKRQKNNLLYLLSVVIVLLGTFIFYNIRLNRQNKIIAEQRNQINEDKILEFERERVLLAARSVMEGEETERSRLAGDLHNGLGGLLSGIKINLSSMKENSVITHENVSAFNHVISLLDTSISELRRIAHNLMPETLNHYGLKTALEDFCSQVSPAGPPVITLKFFGDEIRYTKDIELTMYRIIQELVNNAMKHSDASLITIQVFSEPKRLYAQVLDNGKGFDVAESLNGSKGKGLQNINNRVTAMNGKFDVWSQPDQGTEISVEIEIP